MSVFSILLWIAMQGVPTGIFLRIKPEPMDVPAVRKNILWCRYNTAPEFTRWPDRDSVCGAAGTTDEAKAFRQTVYTCADKSRILLTSESGVRHCVKF